MSRADSQPKRKILDAAIHVFADHGLTGATTRMLARQAGVNSALIYYYFENKQTLFAEAVQTVLQRFFNSLQSHPQPFPGARDRLAFLVNSIFDYAMAHPERMRLITIAFNLHPDLFGQAVHALISRQFPSPLKVLQDGIDQHQLRPIHPLQGWWHIVGVCLFSLKLLDILTYVKPTSARISFPDPTTQRQAIIETLVQGLATTSERSEAPRGKPRGISGGAKRNSGVARNPASSRFAGLRRGRFAIHPRAKARGILAKPSNPHSRSTHP